MPPLMPSGYYSRFDRDKNYERWLYRAGRVVQGAELNETQEASIDRLKRISDVLFKDGAVIRDAGIAVDQTSGLVSLDAGVLYVRGAMRGVAPRTLTVSLTGAVSVGVYLQDSVATELHDPALKEPAVEVRNASEPGAARLKVEAVWGQPGDGTPGEYYGVYTVLNGVVQSTLPPPQVDAVAMGIAAYDRDSTGGHYISEGFRVSVLPDAGGSQFYGLEAGNARSLGRQILIAHAQRVAYAAEPDLKQVVAEQHLASGGAQRIDLARAPVASVGQVLITALKTATVQRGAVNGGTDLLPDSPVVSIVAVNQGGTWNGTAFAGGTAYAAAADYSRVGDGVSWAAGGAEPATGSTYTVAYRYIFNATGTITGADAKGFTVGGAVAGTNIQVTYHWKRPRIDRLCLDPAGSVVWVRGVPNDTQPRHPVVPDGLLGVASVHQTWTDVDLAVGTETVRARSVSNDGTRVQTMPQLESLERKVDDLFALLSEHHLKTEIALTDPTTKRGVFVDPFDNDDKRDAGVAQNAAVVAGALTLPAVGVTVLGANLGGVQTLPLDGSAAYPVVAQTLRTGCMAVNPYMAFEPIPARAEIRPATDFWTQTVDTWTSPLTIRFTTEREVVDRVESLGWLTREIGVTRELVVGTSTDLVSTRQVAAQFLRPIRIDFTLTGFGAGEVLQAVKFDGVPVAFQ